MGYVGMLTISPKATTAEEVKELYNKTKQADIPSLGDDDFEEADPDSKFTLSSLMKAVFEKKESFKLCSQSADFNQAPLSHGGTVYKALEGDFVVMAHIDDMRKHAHRAESSWSSAVSKLQGLRL